MSAYEEKNRSFFIELLVVTAVALAVANVWVNLMLRFMKKIFPESLWMEAVFAAIITVGAVYGLHKIFGDKLKRGTDTPYPILPTESRIAERRPRGTTSPSSQQREDYEML